MIYEAPYLVEYTSEKGNAFHILNQWDATSTPPQLEGSLEVFSTSLIDSISSFAWGHGSSSEDRTFSFFRWFRDFAEMCAYQENVALWFESNQNGRLVLSNSNGSRFEFDAVIRSFSFNCDNSIPPEDGHQSHLCLAISLTFVLTNRTGSSAEWVFSARLEDLDTSGQFQIHVRSFLFGDHIGQSWAVKDLPEGVEILSFNNGDRGDMTIQVPSGTEAFVLELVQDGTGKVYPVDIPEVPLTEYTFQPIAGTYSDEPMSFNSWRFIPASAYPDMPTERDIVISEMVVPLEFASSDNSQRSLSLYRINEGEKVLLAESGVTVMSEAGASWQFETAPVIRADWQLVIECATGLMVKHATNPNATDFEGCGDALYPEAATVPGASLAFSIVAQY